MHFSENKSASELILGDFQPFFMCIMHHSKASTTSITF